ncbi:MAG: CvpA family protein [Parcubacteria group bacterium]
MVILDYILIGIILLLGLSGFKRGFLESLGSIIGLVIATLIASRFYPLAGSWFGGTNLSNVIAFIIIFAAAIKIVSLLFWVLGKVFQIITVLPFVSSFDRLLGLILGLAEGIFVMSIILYFLGKYPLNDWLLLQMSISIVAKTLLGIATIFIPLFPVAVKMIKSF